MRSRSSFVLALSLIVAACGSDVNSVPGGSNSPGSSGTGGSFGAYCLQKGGQVHQHQGQDVCLVDRNLLWEGYFWPSPSRLPRLNPSSPSSSTAIRGSFNIHVQPGDRLLTDTFTGFWTPNTSCINNRRDLDGEPSATYPPYQNEPQGLMVSDGSEVHFLGFTGDVTLNNSGTLRFGFNSPVSSSNFCYYVYFSELRLLHCENTSKQTIPCPWQP